MYFESYVQLSAMWFRLDKEDFNIDTFQQKRFTIILNMESYVRRNAQLSTKIPEVILQFVNTSSGLKNCMRYSRFIFTKTIENSSE